MDNNEFSLLHLCAFDFRSKTHVQSVHYHFYECRLMTNSISNEQMAHKIINKTLVNDL